MRDETVWLAGTEEPESTPWEPFAEPVLYFLESLSAAIRRYPERDEDLMSFAFWCRKAHLEEFRDRYRDGRRRLGRGLTFHIAASNVPLLFGYSLAMGLLSGDSCAVRVSSKSWEQDRVLCRILDDLLSEEEFADLRRRISVFSCERNAPIVREYMLRCDGCVVWGGDGAVSAVRSLPMRPGAVQLVFPDRFGVCILDEAALGAMDDEELLSLAHRFYNDTYGMDQNACSSPQYILWNPSGSETSGEKVHSRWWSAVAREASSYSLTAHKAVTKYETLCGYAMTLPELCKVRRYGNVLYTAELSDIPEDPERVRGKFGLFFEYTCDWREALKKAAGDRLQTVVCAGVAEKAVADFAVSEHLKGIYRVVPVGNASAMDLVWDGQDVILALSRQVGMENASV